MDNQELLMQIAGIMDTKMSTLKMDMTEMVDTKISALSSQVDSKMSALSGQMDSKMSTLRMDVADMMEHQTALIRLEIENRVTERIDALFDGYQLTHEKQLELEQRVEALEHQIA